MGQWLLPKLDNVGPGARGGHACATVGTQVLVFGGSDRAPVTYDDLWVLDTGKGPEGLQWTRITPSFSAGCKVHPRSGATLTAVGSLVYLFGGQEPVTEFRFGDLKVLDTTTWTWSDVQLVYGGSGYLGSLSDIWIFNPAQNAWTSPTVGGTAPPAREMHCAAMVTPTRMVVYGGRGADGSVLCDAVLLDAQDMRWCSQEHTPFPRCAQCCASLPAPPQAASTEEGNLQGDSAAASAPCMIVYGGFSGEAVEGDVLRIDGQSLEVEVLHRGPRQSDSAGTVPKARFAAAAVALLHWQHGPAMCVFGGVSPEEDLADLALWCVSAHSTSPDHKE